MVFKVWGMLEKCFVVQGIEVKWMEFFVGLQLLEGLNVGVIDFGIIGEVLMIFVLVVGVYFVYVGNQLFVLVGEVIIVLKILLFKSVVDFKGKCVVFNKGLNVYYLLVKLLEKVNVFYSDIQFVYFMFVDVCVVFECGVIDVWVIWDLFFVVVE